MARRRRMEGEEGLVREKKSKPLLQVRSDGEIVWEYMNRGGTTRPSVVPYDFTPQLRAMGRPEELSVTPPNNLEWRIEPGTRRWGHEADPTDSRRGYLRVMISITLAWAR